MINPQQKIVLLLGNCQTTEMLSVFKSVEAICENVQIRTCLDWDQIPVDVLFPDLILVCQNWPDEYHPQMMNQLVGRFPLSRLICCYGAWCEADGRTRDIWPPSIRVPVRTVTGRLQLEWHIIQGLQSAFPLTSGRDEIFLVEAVSDRLRVEWGESAPRIHVESGDRAYREMLEARLLSWECRIVQHREEAFDLLVLDLDPWEMVMQRAQALSVKPAVPIIGVMGLAHSETVITAKLCGIETVVCKVSPEQELFQAITQSLAFKATERAEC